MPRKPPRTPSQRALAAAQAMYAPYPAERLQHGEINNPIEGRQIEDAGGLIGSPYRVVDTLEAMEAAGTITAEMRKVGEQFRDDFATAQLDPLKAADMERAGMGAMLHTPYGAGGRSSSVEAARERVWSQTLMLGGISSPAGSCVWNVLGWQQSLNQWAVERGWDDRKVSKQVASGILRAALGVLAGRKGP